MPKPRTWNCYGALGLGAEWRWEHRRWFAGVALGLELKVERYRQDPETVMISSPVPRAVYSPGFRGTLVRPFATLAVQYPGILIFYPFLRSEGRVQPLTRIMLGTALVTPRAEGQKGAFLEQLDPHQITVAVGTRFRN
ncbi:MAG: hypothetical protein HYZ13_13530 [Acidobacteria bacterium]|nr:hypothetical protein [Acidobacteriota bacterium]